MMRAMLALVITLCAAVAHAQPNRVDVVQRVAAADAARFACAHTDRACAYDFIRALVCELRRDDPRWGMNGRRGDPARPSWDAVAYCGAGPATDPTGACRERLTIIDVIAGAGGSDPRPTWQAFTSDPTPGAWLVPECGTGGGAGGGSGGGSPTSPAVDLSPVLTRLDALAAQVTRLSAQVNTTHAALAEDVAGVKAVADAAAHDAGVAARETLIVKDWLAQGLAVSLSARFVGGISGTARAPQ